MARLFNGSSDSMSTASNLTLGSASLSMAFWLWYDDYANTDKYVFELSSNYTTGNDFRLTPGDVVIAGKWAVGVHSSNGFSYGGFTRPSAAAWHHYVVTMQFANPTALTAYVDGVAQTVSFTGGGIGPQNDNGIVFDTVQLYSMARNNFSNFAAGRLAEVALWNGVVLTAAEAAILGLGYAPPLVRPASLKYYWPLLYRQSPESEIVANKTFTLAGTSITAHPAVLYPVGTDIEIAGTASTIAFRKTLSGLGTKVGTRQVMGV